MTSFTVNQRVLMIKQGLCVTVSEFGTGLMLCVVPCQDAENNAPSVDIYENDKNQWAFKFERGSASYFPKVVNNHIELKEFNVTDLYWFEKYNILGGEHYGLRSVEEPRKYLYIKAIKQKRIVCIRQESQDCAQVTDEEVRGCSASS